MPRWFARNGGLFEAWPARGWQYYYSQIPPVNGAYLGGAGENGLPGMPFSATFSVTARF